MEQSVEVEMNLLEKIQFGLFLLFNILMNLKNICFRWLHAKAKIWAKCQTLFL